MTGFMEWAVLVALAFGATFAMWVLDACVIATKSQWLGGALFMFLLLGLPVIVVLWGFATGRLPG